MNRNEQLARLLRGVGEPTRLRLLRLCADRPATVSDLAAALGDSEPNVSRHLKLLAGLGLVVRNRRGQWVEYVAVGADGSARTATSAAHEPAARADAAGDAATLLEWLLGHIDTQDPSLRRAHATLHRSAARAAAPLDRLAAPVAIGSRFGRALRAAMAERSAAGGATRALVLRAAHPEPLQWLTQRSAETWLLARTVAERAALRRRCAQSGLRVDVALARALAGAAGRGRFGEALVDASGCAGEGPDEAARALEFARPLLGDDARVWVVVDYDALERAGAAQLASPPAVLRRSVAAAGLACISIVPVEADGRHVLLACCQPAAAHLAQAG